MASETPNFFTRLLFAADRLLPSGNTILNGTGHKGYLSASVKSRVFPEFTDQDMTLAMILRFTSKMYVFLPILIFTVLPVLVNSRRLFFLLLLGYEMI